MAGATFRRRLLGADPLEMFGVPRGHRHRSEWRSHRRHRGQRQKLGHNCRRANPRSRRSRMAAFNPCKCAGSAHCGCRGEADSFGRSRAGVASRHGAAVASARTKPGDRCAAQRGNSGRAQTPPPIADLHFLAVRNASAVVDLHARTEFPLLRRSRSTQCLCAHSHVMRLPPDPLEHRRGEEESCAGVTRVPALPPGQRGRVPMSLPTDSGYRPWNSA